MARVPPPNLPQLPASLKPVQHFLKTASEYDARDPVISYWNRMYAAQSGLKLDKSSPEARSFLIPLMDWLEKAKQTLKTEEAITNDVVAQAHVENTAWKLFSWADAQDRASVFNKNVVKAFYTAGVLYDVVTTFGELTEENFQHRKYAKWKAAYIHNCLKSGETPVPGPPGGDEDFGQDGTEFRAGGPSHQDEAHDHDRGIGFGGASGFGGPAGPSGQDGGYDLLTGDRFPAQHVPAAQPPPPAAAAGAQPEAGSGSLRAMNGLPLSFDDMAKAQKYCKYATSALQYEDLPTTVLNLRKALVLLESGQDMP